MDLEHTVADFFSQALEGKTNVTEVEGWSISNWNRPSMIMIMGNAIVYGFDVYEDKGKIIAMNYHREARKGEGTPSLQRLHSAFEILAKEKSIPVKVEFPVFNQEDTRAWLIKNGYRNHDELYFREFYPRDVNPDY